jgi:hypothetical protein
VGGLRANTRQLTNHPQVIEERLALFPDPRHSEMLVRWDMVEQPPLVGVLRPSFRPLVIFEQQQLVQYTWTKTADQILTKPTVKQLQIRSTKMLGQGVECPE